MKKLQYYNIKLIKKKKQYYNIKIDKEKENYNIKN